MTWHSEVDSTPPTSSQRLHTSAPQTLVFHEFGYLRRRTSYEPPRRPASRWSASLGRGDRRETTIVVDRSANFTASSRSSTGIHISGWRIRRGTRAAPCVATDATRGVWSDRSTSGGQAPDTCSASDRLRGRPLHHLDRSGASIARRLSTCAADSTCRCPTSPMSDANGAREEEPVPGPSTSTGQQGWLTLLPIPSPTNSIAAFMLDDADPDTGRITVAGRGAAQLDQTPGIVFQLCATPVSRSWRPLCSKNSSSGCSPKAVRIVAWRFFTG